MKRRWYDANKKLSQYVALLRNMGEKDRAVILDDILSLINEKSPEIESKAVLSMNQNLYTGRWYDDFDNFPKVFLFMRVLPYADYVLLNVINSYLDEKFKKKIKNTEFFYHE